ncbi:unnamed protein product [Aphanomyces euteiches]
MRVYGLLVALAAIAFAKEGDVKTDNGAALNDAASAFDQMVQEIDQLKSTNAALDTKYQQEHAQVTSLLSTVEELKTASTTGSERVAELEKELEKLRTVASAAQSKFEEQTANLEKSLLTATSALKKSEEEKQADRVKATSSQKTVEATVEKLTAQLNEANTQAASLKKRNKELEGQLGNVNSDKTAAAEQLQAKVNALTNEIKDLKDKVSELEVQVDADQKEITSLQDELTSTKAKLAQIATLQNQLKDAKKQIVDLKDELKAADAAINWQAVFSSYYDRVADTFENSDAYVQHVKVRTIELYDSHLHPVTIEALKHASVLSESARELYKQHAAAHVDPLIDQVVLAAAPHYEAHYPAFEKYYRRFTENAKRLLSTAEQRFRMTRKWCIGRLKSLYPRIAKYARQMVDFTIFLMVLPLVYAAYRIVVELIYLALYLSTCCCFCGLFGRKPVKHEVAQPVSIPPAADSTAPSTKKNGKKKE